MLKQSHAITLIALIITIIVLLVLAAVTINMVLGENGLFNKAKTSVAKYENAQERENTVLAGYEDEMNSYMNGNRNLSITDEQYKIQNTMSGTEHFTGEYYLNGKPIYEKTVYVASLPNNAHITYNHNIENVEMIWLEPNKSFWVYSLNPLDVEILPYVVANNSGTTYQIAINSISTSTFRIDTAAERQGVAYITFRYTKTTDTATITPSLTTATPNT